MNDSNSPRAARRTVDDPCAARGIPQDAARRTHRPAQSPQRRPRLWLPPPMLGFLGALATTPNCPIPRAHSAGPRIEPARVDPPQSDRLAAGRKSSIRPTSTSINRPIWAPSRLSISRIPTPHPHARPDPQGLLPIRDLDSLEPLYPSNPAVTRSQTRALKQVLASAATNCAPYRCILGHLGSPNSPVHSQQRQLIQCHACCNTAKLFCAS